MTGPRKRSLTLYGHPTSITLEDMLWAELESLAAARNLSLSKLVCEIDDARTPAQSLSGAVRAFIIRAVVEERNRLRLTQQHQA